MLTCHSREGQRKDRQLMLPMSWAGREVNAHSSSLNTQILEWSCNCWPRSALSAKSPPAATLGDTTEPMGWASRPPTYPHNGASSNNYHHSSCSVLLPTREFYPSWLGSNKSCPMRKCSFIAQKQSVLFIIREETDVDFLNNIHLVTNSP